MAHWKHNRLFDGEVEHGFTGDIDLLAVGEDMSRRSGAGACSRAIASVNQAR